MSFPAFLLFDLSNKVINFLELSDLSNGILAKGPHLRLFMFFLRYFVVEVFHIQFLSDCCLNKLFQYLRVQCIEFYGHIPIFDLICPVSRVRFFDGVGI